MFCILKRVLCSPMLAGSVKAGIQVLMREREEKDNEYLSFISPFSVVPFAKAKAHYGSAASRQKSFGTLYVPIHYVPAQIWPNFFFKKWRSSVLLAAYKTTV